MALKPSISLLTAWIAACQAMVILAMLLTIVGFVLAVVALCKGKLYANFYKLGGVLLFLAGKKESFDS